MLLAGSSPTSLVKVERLRQQRMRFHRQPALQIELDGGDPHLTCQQASNNDQGRSWFLIFDFDFII